MRKLLMLCAVIIVAGCATGYQPQTWTGGYSELQVNASTWRVMFAGNAHITHETAQTYWLYRCAELTLEKGYAGFEVMSDVGLVSLPAGRGEEGMLVEIDVPMLDKPVVAGTIRMLKGPVTPRPPKIFDAAKLKARLEPLVKGRLCDENVCPHFHSYLLPDV